MDLRYLNVRKPEGDQQQPVLKEWVVRLQPVLEEWGDQLKKAWGDRERIAQESKQYFKNFLPSLTFVLILFIVFGFLHLFGAVNTYEDCDCVGNGQKGSCVKFSKPSKTMCKATRCKLFSFGMILFGVLFLILKQPGIKASIKKAGKVGKGLAVGTIVAVTLTIIGFLVYDTFFADDEKDKTKENFDDNDETPKKKESPSIFKIILIGFLVYIIVAGAISALFCQATETRNEQGQIVKEKDYTNCFFDGLSQPFHISGWFH